jgi:hypothetical protein
VLNLTRMVQYSLAHLEEELEYPSDYGQLLTLLGGPQLVGVEHMDTVAFER